MGHMAIKFLVGLKSEFARFWGQVLAKAQELRIEVIFNINNRQLFFKR